VEAADGRVSVGLKRLALDPHTLREQARSSDVPLRHVLVQQYDR
jgi:hypothetical protein